MAMNGCIVWFLFLSLWLLRKQNLWMKPETESPVYPPAPRVGVSRQHSSLANSISQVCIFKYIL